VYYVRRHQKIKGPLTTGKLHELHADGRLRGSDEIAEYRDGPWQPVAELAPQLLGVEIPADDNPVARRPPTAGSRADRRAAGDEKIPWEILNSSAVRIGIAVTIGALVLLVLFLTSPGEPEPVEPAVVVQPPPVKQAEPPAAAAAVDQQQPDTDAVERQAIERLLKDFYNAASWRQRYRFVVQDEAIEQLVERAYSGGADFGSGIQKRVEITRIPDENTLRVFRDRPRPICVELKIDRRPTTVFVVYGGVTEGWRIDWQKSFDTWLGR